MIVYHGSKERFIHFNFERVGLNGTQEGKGIYFTDNKKIAVGYAQNCYLYTVNFNYSKSLDSGKLTISKEELRSYLIELDKANDHLSNYGDKEWEGYNYVLEKAIAQEYEGSANDVDLINGIVNLNGDLEGCLTILYELLGYDSIVMTPNWGEQTLYIALTTDVIEILTIEGVT